MGNIMEKKIKVAVIACGNRCRNVINHLLKDSDRQVEIAAAYDPDPAQIEYVKGIWESPDTVACKSVDEAMNYPGVSWVMIFSPNAFHKEHILAAFKAGKHVFTEKPLATSIDDCVEIYDAYKASGLQFATGFVLRYAPLYRRVKEMLDSGKFGRIISINADENIPPYHGGYIMANWRRDSAVSGPHILEKCCHDLDLLNWFCQSHASRAASFGGRNFFLPENERLHEKYGHGVFAKWRDPYAKPSPFTSGGDLMDNQVAIFEYRNGIRVQFQCTMSNAMPTRRMYFSCTEGTIALDLYEKTIRFRFLGSDEENLLTYKSADGHGGGDNYIMKELFETMTKGVPPKCSGDEGLESAVLALAIDRAARERNIVDLEPVWKKLGR
jgi:predicted dehydrogenase